jgi:hypothetical protein
MTNLSVNVEEDWFSINIETKIHRKIDILQKLVTEQLGLIQNLFEEIKILKKQLYNNSQSDDILQLTMIHRLSEEIKDLKGEVFSTKANDSHEKMFEVLSEEIKELKGELYSTHHKSTSQNDRIHQLLEELKILKQRELNMMLREKKPTPFVSANQMLLFANPFVNAMSLNAMSLNAMSIHKKTKENNTEMIETVETERAVGAGAGAATL